MKLYKSPLKNNIYLLYRLISPIIDPIKLFIGLAAYPRFIFDGLKYWNFKSRNWPFTMNIFPRLDDKVSLTPFDAHYFYQQLWVFESIYKRQSKNHTDIGSTYEMSGYLSVITKATFIDLRPVLALRKNLIVQKGDLLNLSLRSNSINSLSCLHTVEHVGLGRYGDNINPEGAKQACLELQRVLAKKGYLYFSTPIGKPRLCFNAHRVFDPEMIINYFSDLKLVSFCVVDDNGIYHENVDWHKYRKLNYGCGMFLFTKV